MNHLNIQVCEIIHTRKKTMELIQKQASHIHVTHTTQIGTSQNLKLSYSWVWVPLEGLLKVFEN